VSQIDSPETHAQVAAAPFDKTYQARGPTVVLCSDDRLLDFGILGMLILTPILLPLFLILGYVFDAIIFVLALLVLIPFGVITVGVKSTYAYFLLDVSPRMYPPSHYDEIVLPRKFIRFWSLAHSQGYQDPTCIDRMMKWLRGNSSG
jgi:hypothetical protein